MDFGDILDRWEKGAKKLKKPGGDDWVDAYPPEETDTRDEEHRNADAARRRLALRNMDPQRSLDLHGLTRKEAFERVDAFIDECRTEGLTKVLVIHGKGLHSKGRPVLGKEIRLHVSLKPFTGEVGTAAKQWG